MIFGPRVILLRPIGRGIAAVLAILLLPAPSPGIADEATISASPVVVTATREEKPSFDVPASIDSVSGEQIRDGQLEVNASEILNRLPGVIAQNRQSYAQDIQISSRGFGARSQFGVRGIRVIIDDIPATMPDGQGSVGSFSLSSAKRIEFLRGPFSALYGNHSGGVVQIFTEDGPPRPIVSASLKAGSYGTVRGGFQLGGQEGRLNYIADLSRFDTDGYRDHSAARRDHFNGKLRYELADRSQLTLVVNALDQPDNQDPLGLTKAELAANPRQASASAFTFNTRRSLSNAQAGLVYEKPLGSSVLRLVGYLGKRSNEQYLAIPLAVQNGPKHSGGVAAFDRDFGGLGLRLTHHGSLAARPLTLILGADYDRMADARKGYINDNGVKGALKRDEDDIADSLGEYLQAEWEVAPRWSLTGGVRYTRVRFNSKDHFITPSNPDDSGSATHSATTPVAGVLFHLTPAVNLYANVGKGFETPTFIEIAYRPDGSSGLNFDLKPTRSVSYEAGMKAFLGAATQLNLALFRVDAKDEIVVFSNSGGRATFQNAGASRRQGLEASLSSAFGQGFEAYASYSYLDATYRDPFTTCTGFCAAPNAIVPAGNRIPGIPREKLYGEISWKHPASGFSTALEAYRQTQVYVNDLNSEFAEGYTLFNWRAGFEQKKGPWRLKEFMRIDNLSDEKYVAAVIVGDANGRYYAPGPERSYLVGVSARYQF